MTDSKQMEKTERIGYDEYFMKIAYVVSERASCYRRKVGAVIVKDNHILTTGYNGAPSGIKDSFEHGNCLRDVLNIPSGKDKHICRGVHAEQNAIIQGAKFGVELRGGTVYCTHGSCVVCAKILINAGIKRFVSCAERKENDYIELFEEAGVEFVQIPKPSMEIDHLDYRK